MYNLTAPDIIFEDNHLLAINKQAGDLSQPDSSGDDPLQDILIRFIKERDQKPGNVYLGTLHRLDRPVTGALIFAKTSKSAARMSQLIRDHNFDKFYIAMTYGMNHPTWTDEWTILEDRLIREGDRTYIINEDHPDAQNGSLMIKTIRSEGSASIHIIKLITGRKHQIRAQLSSRGLPIIGDSRYSSSKTFGNGIALHSFMISFIHPVRKEVITITAKLPRSFVDCALQNNIHLPDESEIMDEIAAYHPTDKIR